MNSLTNINPVNSDTDMISVPVYSSALQVHLRSFLYTLRAAMKQGL